MWVFWPDTNGLPLEEVAAIFGDADEVAIYRDDIEIDEETKAVRVRKAGDESEEKENVKVERV
jgi:hypothetical protein